MNDSIMLKKNTNNLRLVQFLKARVTHSDFPLDAILGNDGVLA